MLSARQIFSLITFVGVHYLLGVANAATVATTPAALKAQAGATPVATPSAAPDLGNRLQAYFINARKDLGNLEAWQLKLFNEEAVPEYQRFVRGYRLVNTTPGAAASGADNGSGISADIDFDSLRNFLRFYAPKSLKREKPSILAVLKPQTKCSKCISGLPEVKMLVASRLERRGFKVIWTAPAEIGDAALTGVDLVTAAKQAAQQKDAVGALVVYWQKSVDDEDAMHPDERHYTIHSALEIREVTSTQEQLEVTDNGSFERSEGKLLADSFTELGAKMTDLEVSQAEINREETVVDVIGIRSFGQFQALKNAFQASLKNATIEEQKISRGHAVFAVFSNSPVEKIQQALGAAKPEGLKLGTSSIQSGEIHLEVTAAAAPAQVPPAQAPPVQTPNDDESSKGDPEA